VNRRHITFACEGVRLAGTLDEAAGTTGLLIVSGGNEIRSGAFAGQASLAARIAAAGYPVFRFDRRGVGDSEGENAGFRASAPDIAAALAAFRAEARAARVVMLGNCDAASALMLARGAGADALVLSNPWTFDGDGEDDTTPPPAAAIRARYAERLKNPREVWRLVSGGVDLRKLVRGLMASIRSAPAPTGLVAEMRAGLAEFTGPVRLLLAGRDRTAQAFAAAWGADPRCAPRESADHAFSGTEDQEWLAGEILTALSQ
jgi:exosortase A-associated hydrolase 1